MDTTEYLANLHRSEEAIRLHSLAVIHADSELNDHWHQLSEAMEVVYAYVFDHKTQNDDDFTLQLIGIRLFNAASASVKLGLSGYYQMAFHQVRDVLETAFLVDYLMTFPDQISMWKAADKKERASKFGARMIRVALDKRDGFVTGRRKEIYDLLSELATHTSYKGFVLVMNGKNLGEIGPFYDEVKLKAWLSELVQRFSEGAVHLNSNHTGAEETLLKSRARYIATHQQWRSKYFPKTVEAPIGAQGANDRAP